MKLFTYIFKGETIFISFLKRLEDSFQVIQILAPNNRWIDFNLSIYY